MPQVRPLGMERTQIKAYSMFYLIVTNLQSSSPYHPVASAEQFISSRSYGTVGGVTPRFGNVVPQAGPEVDYLGGRESSHSHDA